MYKGMFLRDYLFLYFPLGNYCSLNFTVWIVANSGTCDKFRILNRENSRRSHLHRGQNVTFPVPPQELIYDAESIWIPRVRKCKIFAIKRTKSIMVEQYYNTYQTSRGVLVRKQLADFRIKVEFIENSNLHCPANPKLNPNFQCVNQSLWS